MSQQTMNGTNAMQKSKIGRGVGEEIYILSKVNKSIRNISTTKRKIDKIFFKISTFSSSRKPRGRSTGD
jgi:hypothetical protein